MGRVSREKISAIPYHMKSYLTLNIGNQRYMDSLQLMPGSLDSHISNLGAEPCKGKVDKDENSLNLLYKKTGHLYRIDSDRCFAHPKRFPITREHGPKGRDDLVFRKALFPYDWFNTPEKIDATSLPPIEAFDTDCLEGFRKLIKGKFGLDIAHYVSLPLFANDALYKTTEQEIELFTDDNMYLFCEKESEEAMKKLYTWLLYVDANALYTGAMMQSKPAGGHRWITPDETPDLFNKITKWEIPDNAEKGYILEVDLDYLYKLHKAHTSYPLAPENIEISKEEMSKCGQEIINDLKHYTKTKKLIPNLNNKKKYIVH
ncbi:DNA polymerase [Gigaspora margarita]|uniref:DNA polymerase n=1 Tax=Gigaspora margarita TaxID=4874 RepID=A0A8H4EU79_GIGMA|nr:DNA polymerase [Gigaspora margarita]